MPNRIYCKCPNPKCSTEARGLDEIKEKFGFRIIKGKHVPQSWCRECRSSSKKHINDNKCKQN